MKEKLPFIDLLMRVRYCAKCFTCIIAFDHHNSPIREVLLSHFRDEENRGSGNLSNLSVILQLANGRLGLNANASESRALALIHDAKMDGTRAGGNFCRFSGECGQ